MFSSCTLWCIEARYSSLLLVAVRPSPDVADDVAGVSPVVAGRCLICECYNKGISVYYCMCVHVVYCVWLHIHRNFRVADDGGSWFSCVYMCSVSCSNVFALIMYAYMYIFHDLTMHTHKHMHVLSYCVMYVLCGSITFGNLWFAPSFSEFLQIHQYSFSLPNVYM